MFYLYYLGDSDVPVLAISVKLTSYTKVEYAGMSETLSLPYPIEYGMYIRQISPTLIYCSADAIPSIKLDTLKATGELSAGLSSGVLNDWSAIYPIG